MHIKDFSKLNDSMTPECTGVRAGKETWKCLLLFSCGNAAFKSIYKYVKAARAKR